MTWCCSTTATCARSRAGLVDEDRPSTAVYRVPQRDGARRGTPRFDQSEPACPHAASGCGQPGSDIPAPHHQHYAPSTHALAPTAPEPRYPALVVDDRDDAYVRAGYPRSDMDCALGYHAEGDEPVRAPPLPTGLPNKLTALRIAPNCPLVLWNHASSAWAVRRQRAALRI